MYIRCYNGCIISTWNIKVKYIKHYHDNGGNMLRKETRTKIAEAVMDAINDDKISSVADVEKVIDVASLTDKQKARLDKTIEAHEAKLEKLKELRDSSA